MADSVTMRLDTTDVVKGINFFWAGSRKAIPRAVNKTARTTRASLTRTVSKDMKLRARDVRERIVLVPAKRGQEQAFLVARGDRIPLIKFRARGRTRGGRGRGVSYTLPTGRGRIADAWIASIRRGPAVFARVGRERGPVTELHGPSVGLVFAKKVPEAMRGVRAVLMKNLRSELRFAFRRRA